ncbi:MAG: YqaJ viral recombinase family protein [Micavibrio sp.]|nr:YqaJ viral recombinase family protein [Micavibrio sp.]
MTLPPSKNVTTVNGVHYYHDLLQGTDEWHALRCGMITASNVKHLLTPKLQIANNEKVRLYLYEVAANRITNRPDEGYLSYDMQRGQLEEGEAIKEYARLHAGDTGVQQCGFVINDDLGFNFGMSPDGLVGDKGLIEVKSRNQKHQLSTIASHAKDGEIPDEFIMQIQSALFISKREWCDFISYSNGFCMAVYRVFPIPQYQVKIKEAVYQAEEKIKALTNVFYDTASSSNKITPLEWIDHHEEIIA